MFKRNHRKTKYKPQFQQYKSVENQGKKRAKQNRRNKRLIKNAQHIQEFHYTNPKPQPRTMTNIADLVDSQTLNELKQKLDNK